MDTETLIASFRAEAADRDPTARAIAWRELEAKFEEACGQAPGVSARSHRRPLLAMAGAGVLAAVLAAVLLFSSGPSAEPAAAEVLRRVARVAEASNAPAQAVPGPGQFLYAKTKKVELEGWLPPDSGLHQGSAADPRTFTTHVPFAYPEYPIALVSTLEETWTGPDGAMRKRETLASVDFFSEADQELWQKAGSPPPDAFDPERHRIGHDGSGRPVKDFATESWRGSHVFSHVVQLAKLPTDPKALRQSIEGRPAGEAVAPPPAESGRGSRLIERLVEILSEPITTPALRAAAFNALAEIPGIELERNVTAATGHRGDAITWAVEGGFSREVIFDPHTAAVLAQAQVITNAEAAGIPAIPDGTAFREIAFLGLGVVGPGSR
jgi:hypothetical protein